MDPIFKIPEYMDHDDIFLQSVEDLLWGEWSACDFEALGILRLTDIWRERDMYVDIDTWEDYENNKLIETFQKLYNRNRERVNWLIRRQRVLIEDEELTEENDREFRAIWPKIDKVVKICAKTVDRICERTLKASTISLDF